MQPLLHVYTHAFISYLFKLFCILAGCSLGGGTGGSGLIFLLLLALKHLVFFLLSVECVVVSFDVAQDVVYMVSPLNAGVRHAVVDFCGLAQV